MSVLSKVDPEEFGAVHLADLLPEAPAAHVTVPAGMAPVTT